MKSIVIIPDSNSDYENQLKKIIQYLPRGKLSISVSDLTVEFIKREAITIVIAASLSKDWCYLLRGLGVVTICFGRRDYYYDLVDIVIDYKCTDDNDCLTGDSVDFNRVAPYKFFEVAELIRKLDWDSQFFEVNVAYVSCLHLTENIYKAISQYTAAHSIKLLEYLCNCHDRRSILIAEKEGFSFVDIRMTFFKSLEHIRIDEPANDYVFIKATEANISDLKAIAGRIYTRSRYFFDENFGAKKAQKFYENWIEKAVRGEFDDECWCLIEGKAIIAFCSVRYAENNRAEIGLLGVNDTFAKLGSGTLIIERVIDMLVKRGVAELTVVTQGRNYPAQNLYQKAGFKTKKIQLWFHKWH